MATATTSVSVRPLAIPNEHGGWGILLEPLVIALIVAPSMAGAGIAVAMVGAFFLRHPLKFGARDWLQRKRYPRTVACERLVMAYGAVAVAGLTLAALMSGPAVLLPLLMAAPLAAVQLAYDVRNRGRELTPELAGAIGAGAGGAACVLAGGGAAETAALLWLFAAFRSAPAVLHVRALLRRRGFAVSIGAHVLVLVVLGALSITMPVSAPVVAIFTLLLFRAVSAPIRGSISRPSVVGVEELLWGIATAGAIALGFLIS